MDALAGTVVALENGGSANRFFIPSRVVTTIRRRVMSGFVLGTERGVILADDELTDFEFLAEVTENLAVRTNDGGCDPLGGFVIGTMNYDETPDGGAVYRVSPSGTVTKLLIPVSISNGVQWAADGRRVFYIDTARRRVDAFDVSESTGAWSNRQTHIQLDGFNGFPDGMAIDDQGGLWVAMWGGGNINHFDSSGKFIDEISVPGVSQVSSCTFGGDDRSVLFITTSRKDLTTYQEPDAGAIFSFHTAARGAVLWEFAD